jgi:hypothetical protein
MHGEGVVKVSSDYEPIEIKSKGEAYLQSCPTTTARRLAARKT